MFTLHELIFYWGLKKTSNITLSQGMQGQHVEITWKNGPLLYLGSYYIDKQSLYLQKNKTQENSMKIFMTSYAWLQSKYKGKNKYIMYIDDPKQSMEN